MKKVTKVISVLMIVFMIVSMSTMVLAADYMNPNTMVGSSNADTNSITGIGNSIVKIVGTVGMITAVVVLIVLGIKYMMGSAEEKAEYKKTLLPYVIGAVLIFAATVVVTVIANFGTSIQA